MPVPLPSPNPHKPSRLARLLAPYALLAGILLPAHAAKPNEPFASIALEDLGYQGVPARYLTEGATVFTVHFVDNTHLLVTFTSRGLLTRLADAQETDQDQNVTAVLLELPTNKVLAKTVWRERDRGQYLWPLPHGRFILRLRTKLSVLDPLGNLAAGKAFEEEPFVELHRPVGYIDLSPGGDLVSIETTPVPKPKPKEPTPVANSSGLIPRSKAEAVDPDPILINFYRPIYEDLPGKPGHLIFQAAGLVKARNLIDVPATADGYLDISQESPGVFLFDFQAHGGKRLELAPYDTTCAPRAHFISPTEFIAFGCRGSDDRQQMAAFNLHGDEPWVNAFPNHHLFPYIAAAPSAGRFALSRTLLNGTYIDPDNILPEQVSAQEVTVMQNWDGRTLLKLAASPFQRVGQNFDLSPDGLSFVIIRDAKIQTFRLPALSRKDSDALKLASASAPEHTSARISLGGKPTGKAGLPEEKASDEAPVTAKPEAATDRVESQTKPALAATPAESQAAPTRQILAEPNAPQNGDLDPSQRRPIPSLYTPQYPRQKGDPKPSTDATPR